MLESLVIVCQYSYFDYTIYPISNDSTRASSSTAYKLNSTKTPPQNHGATQIHKTHWHQTDWSKNPLSLPNPTKKSQKNPPRRLHQRNSDPDGTFEQLNNTQISPRYQSFSAELPLSS